MNSVASRVTPRLSILERVVAAIVGGHAFGWGLIVLALVCLGAFGMLFDEAEHLSNILVYLVTFLWAFVARSLVRLSAFCLVVLHSWQALLRCCGSQYETPRLCRGTVTKKQPV